MRSFHRAADTAFLLLICCVSSAVAFLNIAHMVTTPQALLWAVDQMGANAVEMDLSFDDAPGGAVPVRFRHSPDHTTLCDCWCYLLLNDSVPHVCTQLTPNTSFEKTDDRCMISSNATAQLNLIATKPTIALLYIDSKIDQVGKNYSDDKLFKTGQNAYALLAKQLVQKGYKGKVLVSAGTAKYKAYLKGAWASAKADKAKNFFFTVDMDEYDSAYAVMKELKQDGAPVIYSKGLTTCALVSMYKGEIGKASKDPMFNETIVWTIDKPGLVAEYLAVGATGVLTNKPYRVYTLASSRNLFATVTREDVPPSRPTFSLPCQAVGCDCSYSLGGCTITAEAMPGCACKCDKNVVACDQTAVPCNASQPLCAKPNNGLAACLYAGGDCGGYPDKCNCNYRSGGCVIMQPAPPNTACKCRYTGLWSCLSSLTGCQDYSAPQCAAPGSDKLSCQQGGGNCNGYK